MKHVSLKGKVFILFISFAVVLLAVLWFFQIVYLDDFYKFVKRSQTEAVMDEVEEIIASIDSDDDILQKIEGIAANQNLAIYITDSKGRKLYNAEYIYNSRMSSLTDSLFKTFYEQAKDNGDEATFEYIGNQMKPNSKSPGLNGKAGALKERIGEDAFVIPYTMTQEHGDNEFKQNIGDDFAESLIYVRIITVNNKEMVLMVNSVLTPVDATVSTLKIQLAIITLIVIVVALVLASLFSRRISKSIMLLNEAAKALGKGDYDVHFDSSDYREIAELSDSLNHAAHELGKADALQKDLIANVSHDLRTPLTMIKGYSEVMRDIPGESTPENFQVIIEETDRLSGLVEDMLNVSRLQAGTVVLNRTNYNITESVRHVLERYNKLCESKGYLIDFSYDSEVYVLADEAKIYQVVYNLINNAINYTGEDKKVFVHQKLEEGLVLIEICDTGDGVKEEDIPYVWDRYYKDKKKQRRDLQGTGLGLSIVKNLLEMHGFTYGLRSKPGEGATFWFRVPVVDNTDD